MMDVSFTWSRTFFSSVGRMFSGMQTKLDQTCIKYMNQYVPVAPDKYPNAGKLKGCISNPEPGRIIYSGSGSVLGGVSLARHAYYTPMDHTRSGNPQATHMWFETMKMKDAGRIRSELSKVAGGRK